MWSRNSQAEFLLGARSQWRNRRIRRGFQSHVAKVAREAHPVLLVRRRLGFRTSSLQTVPLYECRRCCSPPTLRGQNSGSPKRDSRPPLFTSTLAPLSLSLTLSCLLPVQLPVAPFLVAARARWVLFSALSAIRLPIYGGLLFSPPPPVPPPPLWSLFLPCPPSLRCCCPLRFPLCWLSPRRMPAANSANELGKNALESAGDEHGDGRRNSTFFR